MRPSELITTILWIPILAGCVYAIHHAGLAWWAAALTGIPLGLALTLALKFLTSRFD